MAYGMQFFRCCYEEFAPAKAGGDRVSGFEFRRSRIDNTANGPPRKRNSQSKRGDIRWTFVHAAAHVGVHRNVGVTHEHLTFLEEREPGLHQCKVLLSGNPLGATNQMNLAAESRCHSGQFRDPGRLLLPMVLQRVGIGMAQYLLRFCGVVG